MRRKQGALVPLEEAICASAAALRRRGVKEFHGYELARQMADDAERRLLTAYGTLYRALGRLESMGMLQSRREGEPPGTPALHVDRTGRRGRARGDEPHARETAAARTPPCGASMMPGLLRFANALVRAWTRFYTWRLPPALRDARREQIDSD